MSWREEEREMVNEIERDKKEREKERERERETKGNYRYGLLK